jgi:serine/alanine adding enzyme
MIIIREYEDTYRQAWADFVETAPQAAIAHLIGWKNVMEKGLGHKPVYLMAMDGSTIKGILPMALVQTWWRTRYLISLPWIDYGGICCDNGETLRLIQKRADELANQLKVSIDSYDSALVTRQDKVTFRLNLDKDPEIVWKKFDAKLRNQIRKAEKSGLYTELGGLDILPQFYKVFQWKMRDLGTPVWGYRFFETILNEFPDTAKIMLVKKENMTIGGGLVLSFKNMLYVPSAASYNEYLRLCPNHALYWNVIKMGCEKGYGQFDFGRSTWDSPTFNFKKQWVNDPIQLNWQYSLIGINDLPAINPENKKYKLMINIWRRLPLPLTNYLGPKVIKNFP